MFGYFTKFTLQTMPHTSAGQSFQVFVAAVAFFAPIIQRDGEFWKVQRVIGVIVTVFVNLCNNYHFK